jgi:hypothetical protein
MNQRLLGVIDGVLDGLKLLRDLSAGPPLLDHLDNRFEMTIGTLQAPGNRRMGVVRH